MAFSKTNRYSFKKGLPKHLVASQSFNLRHDNNDDGLKVAVVVSKKVDKRSVVRNRIRRKFLEVIKKIDTKMPLDLVFYVKRSGLEATDLKKEIELAFDKIKK